MNLLSYNFDLCLDTLSFLSSFSSIEELLTLGLYSIVEEGTTLSLFSKCSGAYLVTFEK